MQINKKIVYVTGLPRAGSTLMCQILGQHPDVYSVGHSSPLNQAVNNLRHKLSDNNFLLAQLDVDFELVHQRMLSATRGFINGWFEETDLPVVVDKNRGWLRMVEMMQLIDPDFQMIVCVRDLRQIFGSVEKQHKKTRLIDFPDHTDPHSISNRANRLFNNGGVIGGPLKGLENMQDIEDDAIRSRLCYVTYEQLITNTQESVDFIYDWLGLSGYKFTPDNMSVKPHESDSYYRFKYRHRTFPNISGIHHHELPPRIERDILKKHGWFFKQFYPEVELPGESNGRRQGNDDNENRQRKKNPT